MRDKFIPKKFVPTKHPFVPHKESIHEEFIPRKKSEKKVKKVLDFIPKT